jgi:hypothetical protein
MQIILASLDETSCERGRSIMKRRRGISSRQQKE